MSRFVYISTFNFSYSIIAKIRRSHQKREPFISLDYVLEVKQRCKLKHVQKICFWFLHGDPQERVLNWSGPYFTWYIWTHALEITDSSIKIWISLIYIWAGKKCHQWRPVVSEKGLKAYHERQEAETKQKDWRKLSKNLWFNIWRLEVVKKDVDVKVKVFMMFLIHSFPKEIFFFGKERPILTVIPWKACWNVKAFIKCYNSGKKKSLKCESRLLCYVLSK